MNSVSDILLFFGLIIGALLAFSLIKKEPSEYLKLLLFCGLLVAIILPTAYLAAVTVAENQASVTGGPVHWHADFEIYACGEPVDLKNPQGISNRIGEVVLHEHGDNRIHVEGVVRDFADVNLARFFEAIGGEMRPTYIRFPTDTGDITIQNGFTCHGSPGDAGQGHWQAFRYKTEGNRITQEKLENFADYVLAPYSQIPPGDCLILEFSQEIKSKTEKMCNFYKVAIQNGDLIYGN